MRSDYYGVPMRSLSNPFLRIEFLVSSGLRIVGLWLEGVTENLLAEVPEMKELTPYGNYNFYGGHRLWHAPESFPRTYLPENRQVIVEEHPESIRLIQAADDKSGVTKSMKITLSSERPEITILHELRNDGMWGIELAPWAITQVRNGGIGFIPQQMVSDPREGLLPNRHISLWPYTRVSSDNRLDIQDDFIFVKGSNINPALKVGAMNWRGWMGYLYQHILFLKRFTPQPDLAHPDFGCNTEIYTDKRFIELETLGPLQNLAPGQSTNHTETWEFHTHLDYPSTAEGVRKMVQDLNLDQAES